MNQKFGARAWYPKATSTGLDVAIRNEIHRFYTGFSWDEIKEIAKALRRTYRKSNEDLERNLEWDDNDYFDYPGYGGLPDKISNRLTTDQVDYLNQEQPKLSDEVARVLARGYIQ